MNRDFDQIKDKLIEYLIEIEGENNISTDKTIEEHVLSDFKLNDFSEKIQKQKINDEWDKIKVPIDELKQGIINAEELYEDTKTVIHRIKSDKRNLKKVLSKGDYDLLEYFKYLPKDILFLDFNYTSTVSKYKNSLYGRLRDLAIKNIQIHGDLEDENNPVIFGFGDEIDDNYSVLENINENKFLDYVKSIEYLQTNNYKNLLNYIESDVYQIFIMGHSCGLSDRTLLNTLFEHKNCVSIKPFYYSYKDDKGKQIDNYKDLIQNISRNFTDKVKMRDVVVNKKFCEPLT